MTQIIKNQFSWNKYLVLLFFKVLSYAAGQPNSEDAFPPTMQGTFYSWEYGHNNEVFVSKQTTDLWGPPLLHSVRRQDIHDYIFRRPSGCLTCSRFFIRSWNVMERIDSSCMNVNLTLTDIEALETVGCQHLFRMRAFEVSSQNAKELPPRGVMMYREDPSPVNCRYSIQGNFRFAYQIQDSFTGECQHYKSRLHSCEIPGSQFFISNQKFFLDFSKCEGIKNSYEGSGEYMCLGEWREGFQHFFVAANLRESRKEERFKCFLKNREDPYYLGMSRSPSCKFLTTPDNSPVRIRLEPLRENVEPTCFLPSNISGAWISSGQGEPQVLINSTHITESRWIGHQMRQDVSVCIQSKGKRFLLAKVSEFGCQAEYVCWEMIPRHHNIVRYRKSRAMIWNTFEVCDYKNFENSRHWKYDTLISEEPKPIECPFSGRFTFGQKGSTPLATRVLYGITQSPLDTYHCAHRQTDLSICDSERKNMIIDLDYCFSLNRDGHPTEIKSIPDYRLNCVGFWKENLVSYLVTHDPSDSVSRFRCWVYQRVSLTELRLSQGLGSACGLHQMYTSSSLEDGAALALNLTFIERIHDRCPMYYNDGSNPWKDSKSNLKIFTFRSSASHLQLSFIVIILMHLMLLVF